MNAVADSKLVRSVRLGARNSREVLQREWLLTNGLGGYASGTISGQVTRRYHGLLVAALPAPLGRVVMFNHLAEYLCLPDGRRVQIGGEELETAEGESLHAIAEFRLEDLRPVWRIEIEGVTLEKRVLLINGQNTVHVSYQLLGGPEGVRLELRPSFHYRGHEFDVGEALREEYVLRIQGKRYELLAGDPYPPLRLFLHGEKVSFTHDAEGVREVPYQLEAERGYRSRGQLWSPGYFNLQLSERHGGTLIASAEDWATIDAICPEEAAAADSRRQHMLIDWAGQRCLGEVAAELVLAADQFIMTPAGRVEDAARARASGDEIRSVIAGYHWFTDWGRDTMISLEGLTLTTGRHTEAGWILRTFAHYIRDGLIPNYFPDGKNEGVYHTADATLWYFHALDRFLETTGDRSTLRALLPKLQDVVKHHLQGTRFGIGVDTADGLLKQGAEGYQLTWMDAKVDGWVVTPRRGKAVEINALWYNALRLLEGWLREEQGEEAAAPIAAHADRARASFNQRFWNEPAQMLFDVVDGETGTDAACRPNQIFSISLKHPVLDESRWPAVLEAVRTKLLTPVGLRSLSADHPDYKPRYYGDLRARDAAYHQGTVWGWLIGPYVDAWLKVHPEDKAGARKLVEALLPHLDHACVGSISEIFDAEAPFAPRGCIAQAWSVAEVLRCLSRTQTAPSARPLTDIEVPV
jgi:predicted glycogen debranching enzyme